MPFIITHALLLARRRTFLRGRRRPAEARLRPREAGLRSRRPRLLDLLLPLNLLLLDLLLLDLLLPQDLLLLDLLLLDLLLLNLLLADLLLLDLLLLDLRRRADTGAGLLPCLRRSRETGLRRWRSGRRPVDDRRPLLELLLLSLLELLLTPEARRRAGRHGADAGARLLPRLRRALESWLQSAGRRLIDDHRALLAGETALSGETLARRTPAKTLARNLSRSSGLGLTIIGNAGCWRRHSPPPRRGGGGRPTMKAGGGARKRRGGGAAG